MRANAIGRKPTRAMKRRKMMPADIAARTGKQLDHSEVVFGGPREGGKKTAKKTHRKPSAREHPCALGGAP